MGIAPSEVPSTPSQAEDHGPPHNKESSKDNNFPPTNSLREEKSNDDQPNKDSQLQDNNGIIDEKKGEIPPQSDILSDPNKNSETPDTKVIDEKKPLPEMPQKEEKTALPLKEKPDLPGKEEKTVLPRKDKPVLPEKKKKKKKKS